MEFLSLSATFGRLKQDTLSLSPGLNVIEAANESGKSTWMAFIKVMLYGLNTRDRGSLADKNRYMPWDGSAMQGSMDLLHNGKAITVVRDTARTGIPMGAFSASYRDTSESVPGLTSSLLGETLLGVPQEVFERSAFIRQSGISIDQAPALEQRITSLITSGEEDSSFSDAADRLRRQLNRRRYNRTGLLPQLETEIDSLEATLEEVRSLEDTVRSLEEEQTALREQEKHLLHQLDLCDAAENAHRLSRLNEALDALSDAKVRYDALASRVASLPGKDELSNISEDLTAAEAMIGAVRAARNRVQECTAALDAEQQKLSAHPFAPLPPEQTEQVRAPQPYHTRGGAVVPILSGILCAALFPVLYWIVHLSLSLSLGAVLVCGGALLILNVLLSFRRQKRSAEITAQHQAEFREELAAYTILYGNAERARAVLESATQSYNALAAEHRSHLEKAMKRVSGFGSVDSVDAARRSIQQAIALHSSLQEAAQRRHQAQLRYDLLAETAPQTDFLPGTSPELSRTEAEARLAPVTAALEKLTQQLHTLQGRISAQGDTASLRATLEQKRSERETLRKEHDALTLALEVLTDANTILQTRFSPALGEKAANIFTKLTKEKYNKVLLDRKMVPSARQSGDALPHAVTSLSQGAADQLYLAVRLAVCDMVLPKEKCVPICLDDALVTFDDDRMAAALDYLVELSETRQILLFTCQKREQAYLRSAHPGKYHSVTLS